MRAYTGFPLVNTKLAYDFLHDHAHEVDSAYWNVRSIVEDVRSRARVDYHQPSVLRRLAVYVDDFMAKHPRGKGTKGNPLLREFYAACHVIKAAGSRNRRGQRLFWRNADAVIKMGTQARTALLKMPGDGSIGERPKMSARTFDALYEAGFIDGTLFVTDDDRERFLSPASVFLTDLGMKAHETASQMRQQAETKRVAQEAADLEARRIAAIKTIATMDPLHGDLNEAIRLAQSVLR